MGRKKKEVILQKIPTEHSNNFVPPKIKSEKEFDLYYDLTKIDLIFNPIINHGWYGIREMSETEIKYIKQFKKDFIKELLLKEFNTLL